MNTKRLVGTFDSHRHIDPAFHRRIGFVLLAKLRIWRLRADHRLEFCWLPANHWNQFRQPVCIAIRNVQHAGNVLEHSFGGHPVEGDDLRNLVFPVALRDVVDHLASALDAEIGVDIWHRLALRVQESLKQKAIAHWIDVGDSKGVGHE